MMINIYWKEIKYLYWPKSIKCVISLLTTILGISDHYHLVSE